MSKLINNLTNFLNHLGHGVIGVVIATKRSIHLVSKRLERDKKQKTPWFRGVLFDLAGVTRKRKLRLLKRSIVQLLKFVITKNQFLKLWTRRVTIPLKRSLNFHLPTMSHALTASHNLTHQPYTKRNVFSEVFARI
ncbi:MAG: hypothetical protein ABIJ22_04620 [Patescibacteria group bacterium]